MQLHIISRDDAKSRGLSRYFTGVPCMRGGVAERLASTSACLCPACKEFYKGRRQVAEACNPGRLVEKSNRNKRWRSENAAMLKEYKRERYIQNRETALEKARRYNIENQAARIAYGKRYWAENRARFSDRRRAKYAEAREVVLVDRQAYYAKNRDAVVARQSEYRKKNPLAMKAFYASSRAARRARIPSWFGEFDRFVVEEAFELAALRQSATGVAWHVDHMIPFVAKLVSGLHCWNNIQVIPAKLNLIKRNRLVMTAPGEWLTFVDGRALP